MFGQGGKRASAALCANVRYADFAVIRFWIFANAASSRTCGKLAAAARRMSSIRPLGIADSLG